MINVLSVFDGMSCGRIALERQNIPITSYYASEIDKYAITIAKKNYPDTQHIGDVTQVSADDLPQIDLLIGGSPCQGFSFAGKPRSKLFFEFVRLLRELNPKYFLLENVRMKKEYQDIISECLGVEPIKINSSLVSAQNRVRLYWTNIPNVTVPEDKGIVLADIIDDGFVDRDKSHCIDANYFKGGNLKSYFEKHRRQLVFSNDGLCREPKILQIPHGYNKGGLKENKSPSMTTSSWQHNNHLTYDDGLTYRKLTPIECERLQTVPDNYTEGVSNTQRYRMLGNGWTVDVISHILKNIK